MNADAKLLARDSTSGWSLPPQYAPSGSGLDPAAAIALGWRWIEAMNRCDADALIDMADRDIALHPTKLAGDQARYQGHDGVRAWIAHLSAAGFARAEQVTEIRHRPPAELVLLGQIVVADKPISPFSMMISLHNSKIVETHAYLSDEAELKRIGHMPG